MAHENFDQDNVSNSKLHMIRCLIAMAHADGVICDEERAYISALTNRLPLSDEQRDILEDDLTRSQDVGALFTQINDPRYRGQVVYFARLMAHKDGNLDPSEQDLLDRLHAMATDGLDIDSIREKAKKAAEAELFVHDISIDEDGITKHGHRIPYFQWLDEVLLAIGIDLLKD